MSYDPWGNMQQSGDFSFTQQFTAQNQIQGYSYDAGGRGTLLNDGLGNDYVYNADGLVVQATSSDGTGFAYDYDAEGHRVQTLDGGGDSNVYIYFGGRILGLLAEGVAWTDYIYANGTLLAEVAGTQDAAPIYRITDHLGSLAQTSDGNGNLTNSWELMPYGQQVQGPGLDASNAFLFGRLFRDLETGSDHADFRQYQSVIGSWMSPDPYGGSYKWGDPQTLQRYSYVRGMATAASDPSGQFVQFAPIVAGSGFCPEYIAIVSIAAGVVDLLEFLDVFGGPHFQGTVTPRPGSNFAPADSSGDPTPLIWSQPSLLQQLETSPFGAMGFEKNNDWSWTKPFRKLWTILSTVADDALCAYYISQCGSTTGGNSTADNVNKDPMKLLIDAEQCQAQGRSDCSDPEWTNTQRTGFFQNWNCKEAVKCTLQQGKP